MEDIWKEFGRETDAGKQLFSLYKATAKPTVSYPKPRQMTESQKSVKNEEKRCPQKTAIAYPTLPVKGERKYHPIDFVPKRKTKEDIDQEVKEQFRYIPKPAPGVDRKKKIEDLQDKFEFRDVKPGKVGKKESGLKKGGFIVPSYARDEEDAVVEEKVKKDEYEELFDKIVEEIEERQAFLKKMNEMAEEAGGAHLKNKEIEKKMKAEISERISELQRLRELRP